MTPRTAIRRILIPLLLLAAVLVGPLVVTAGSGGAVAADTTTVPDQPVSRKLFDDGTLAENLIAAGEWIEANDLCTVYGVDADPGASQAVEVFFLRECYEWVEEGTQ